MPSHRPSPRKAGLPTLVLACALIAPLSALAIEANESGAVPELASWKPAEPAMAGPETTEKDAEAADTAIHVPAEPAYRAALTDALAGEAAALSAFAERQKQLANAAPAGDDAIQLASGAPAAAEASLAAIQSLHGEDVEISERLDGMRQARTSEQLLASLGGTLDLKALEMVEVDESSESWRCLAEAMYFEARGEGLAGQVAVGEVILNRVDSSKYPDSVCEVVSQGSGNGRACQFSYHCDGLDNHVNDMLAWDQVGKVAALMLGGRPRILTDDALYFHNTSVRPSWAKKFVRTAKIGQHVFYRPKVRLSMN